MCVANILCQRSERCANNVTFSTCRYVYKIRSSSSFNSWTKNCGCSPLIWAFSTCTRIPILLIYVLGCVVSVKTNWLTERTREQEQHQQQLLSVRWATILRIDEPMIELISGFRVSCSRLEVENLTLQEVVLAAMTSASIIDESKLTALLEQQASAA